MERNDVLPKVRILSFDTGSLEQHKAAAHFTLLRIWRSRFRSRAGIFHL